MTPSTLLQYMYNTGMVYYGHVSSLNVLLQACFLQGRTASGDMYTESMHDGLAAARQRPLAEDKDLALVSFCGNYDPTLIPTSSCFHPGCGFSL